MNELSDYYRILIIFLKEQNKAVEKYLGVTILTDEDVEEILNWDVSIIMSFMKDLKEDMETCTDTSLTPWCHRYSLECSKCGYGMRHGICSDSDSTWAALRAAFEMVDDFNVFETCHINGVRDAVHRLCDDYEILCTIGLYKQLLR